MPRPIKKTGKKVPRPSVRRRKPSPTAAVEALSQSIPPIPAPGPVASVPEISFWGHLQAAFQACMKMWPLFFVQLFVALLNLAMLGVVLLIGCWPLISSLAQSFGDIFQNPESYDPQELTNKLLSYTSSDSSWIGIFLGLLFIYFVWALLLEALANGAIYGGFWRHKREEKGFSLGDMAKDSVSHFLDFLGALLILAMIYLGVVGVYRLAGWAGNYLVKSLHLGDGITMVILVVAGIPFFILYFCLMIFLMVYSLAVKAWVGNGRGVLASLSLGWATCRAKGWHFTKGNLLSFLGLAAVFMAFEFFLLLTLFLPLIGFLSFFGMIFTTVFFLIFMSLFFPALSVGLLDERESQA